MRRRTPGFYVAVRASALAGPGAPELLDGPWATREDAARRGREVQEQGRGTQWRVVLVDSDGVTVREAD